VTSRILYYLTADERLGDLLDEVTWSHLGRATNTPTDPQTWEVRIGPTWATYCSNWLTAWEQFSADWLEFGRQVEGAVSP
jgi:hypothetical protein